MQMLVVCVRLALMSPFHAFLPPGSAFHKGTIVAFRNGKDEKKKKSEEGRFRAGRQEEKW